MLKIGSLILGRVPCVAASITDKTSHHVLLRAKREGLDIAEMRVDLFFSYSIFHLLKEAARFSKVLPVLATVRSSREGGRWNKPERVRLALYEALIPAVDAIDIELSSKKILKLAVRKAEKHGKTIVLSYHNFKHMPSPAELKTILKKAKDSGANIVKIAAQAKNSADVRTLAEFTEKNQKSNLITIAMGEQGTLSRVLFPSLGSLITFAHLGNSSAPGQLDLKTTVTRLKSAPFPVHTPSAFV